MIWFSNMILFEKKVYEEWETKGKLTHLKIILIRCFVLRERIIVPKMPFLASVRKPKKKTNLFLNNRF